MSYRQQAWRGITQGMMAVWCVFGAVAQAAPLKCKNCVDSAQLKNNSVQTAKIANGSVTGPKIAASSVTASKIAPGAVGGSKITAGGITLDKLAQEARGVGVGGVAALSAVDFNPDGSDVVTCFRDDETPAWVRRPGTGACCIQAPVHVPYGARIVAFEVTAQYAGNSSVDVELRMKDVRSAESAQGVGLVTFAPGVQPQTVRDEPLSVLVDTTTRALYIRACLVSENDSLYGARVIYQ